jgi:hypothetical protein
LDVPNGFGDMGAEVARIRCLDDVVACVLKNPANGIAQNQATQVSDVECFVRVGLRVLNNDFFLC